VNGSPGYPEANLYKSVTLPYGRWVDFNDKHSPIRKPHNIKSNVKMDFCGRMSGKKQCIKRGEDIRGSKRPALVIPTSNRSSTTPFPFPISAFAHCPLSHCPKPQLVHHTHRAASPQLLGRQDQRRSCLESFPLPPVTKEALQLPHPVKLWMDLSYTEAIPATSYT